jgi:hypothetical protein
MSEGKVPMFHRILCAVVAVLLLATRAHSAPKPKQCPVEGFSLDKIQDAARNAPSCDKALEVFSLCAAGASSDVILGGIVTEKCEAVFLPKLSPRERRAYARAQDRCDRRYQRQMGSMYRAFTAFCGAELAHRYARRFGKRQGAAGAARK